MAEIVIKPSGGLEDFFEMNLMACLKLQKVSGILGLRSKIFTARYLTWSVQGTDVSFPSQIYGFILP